MGIEYYVGFTDAVDEGESMTAELIEHFETHVFGNEEFEKTFGKGHKWEFGREKFPYIGELNVFKTDNKDIAQLIHEEMKALYGELDAYVFPVKSSKK